MKSFAYHRAGSLADALAAARLPGASYLAGGTELLNWMRLGIAAPAHVVDISRIAELRGISRQRDGALRIGALGKLNEVALHPDVVRDLPVLSQAILAAASPQLRNLATVGGNPLQRTRCAYFRQDDAVPCNKRVPGSGCSALHGLNDKHAIFGWSETCVATHPADPPVALAALDALAVLRASDGTTRQVPVEELIVLPTAAHPEVDHVLRPGELIVAFVVPAAAPRSVYLKVRERQSYEYAIVSCAVVLELDGPRVQRARIALGSVAHKPWRLRETERRLVGTRLGSPEARAAIDAGFATARPLAMNGYKKQLSINAVVRALDTAGGLP